VKKINDNKKVNLPTYEYPNNILTVSQAQKIVENNINWEVSFNQCKHISQLESQKKHKKTLFGSGFLLSEKVAAEKVAAEKVAAEKEIKIIWELSPKELEIIKALDCET
jgi:formate dehydrogenase assembly factor FdhD